MESPIFQPVAVLLAWTMVMWISMYATRIPAMQKAKIDLDPSVYTTDDLKRLPRQTQWKADNYNHLFEQPTAFYAVAILLGVTGTGDGLNLYLAWGYVALRILHSLVQATVNIIIIRFSIFALSTLCLMALVLHAVIHIFLHH